MSSAAGNGGERAHAAGAFDVRNVIAALIGFYGVVLVVVGLFGNSADDRDKTGDVNANLWAGLVMVLVAIAFAVWSRVRPVVVDEQAVAEARAEQEN
jgi:glucose uptake protein GlcU